MLKWLARQRQQLHGFYRDGFGRAFGMTALAFAVVMVVSLAGELFRMSRLPKDIKAHLTDSGRRKR